MDRTGDCESCRASSVHNELTDESKEWLVRAYATLARRFRWRIEWDRRPFWEDYPHE